MMKKLIVFLITVITCQVGYSKNAPQQKTQSDAIVYTCPMHPEVLQKQPGKCPKCGMALVKKKKIAVKNTVVAPKKTSSDVTKKPSSKKEVKTNITETPNTGNYGYTCPMHPEVRSNSPGKCPKCAMNLVKDHAQGDNGKNSKIIHPKETNDKKADRTLIEQGDGDDPVMANIRKAKVNLGPIKTVSSTIPPRTVRYDLYIADTTVTYGKKSKRAIAVNGQIPMPTLTFTEGDTALIYVHNNLDEETSLHWHGLFLPNKMDGVPFLTQMPIKPHSTYIYKFPIIQNGTHWYHSHTKLQEQIGMYGAFIMNKRVEWDIPTIPVVISEWTDMTPEEVHRSLKNATDWFAIQKGATQSYAEAVKSGNFKTKLINEWKRMNAMDVSDVYYDTFLLNGKNQNEQNRFTAGDKVRLRIINSGASDYFWLSYAGGKITVVATDGNDVDPIEVDRLIIAVSETYDVVVTIPENKSYEFLVTPEDRTKSASLWLGKGQKVPAARLPKLQYFAGMKMMNEMMDMRGNMIEMEGMKMQNQIMDMNTVMYPEVTGAETPQKNEETTATNHNMSTTQHSAKGEIVTLNYDMLRDPKKTTLPNRPWKELKFELTGNMNRYVWTLDNKTVSESDKILIKKGENVRIILYNNSMMRHPMHLHGHDFRVVNSQREYAPMKNVLDIMPMERDTIEFAATEPGGDWFFHCHILYHMMSGMGRVFSYDNSPPNPEIPDTQLAQRKLFSDDRAFHFMATIGLESNGSDGELMLANTRYRLSSEFRIGLKAEHGNEIETYFGRYFGKMQWFMPFVGFDYHYNTMGNIPEKNIFGQLSNQMNRKAAVVGFQYTLPMLFIAEARLDSKGKMRLQMMREDMPLSKRLRLNLMGNTDKEYMFGLRYIVSKYFSLSTHYDSDMGYGAGIVLNY